MSSADEQPEITWPRNSASPTPIGAEPVLSWNSLNYDIKVKGGTKRILHDVSGSIYPGEIVAIMGASGAGKTTLLNILSGRVQSGKLEGSIQFQGAPRNPHTFKRMLGFVEQDDLMHATLTVEETLLVSAQLRLPNAKYSLQDKKDRVSTILRQLRLSQVKDSPIGGDGKRGVSGGERKRTSIGMELVTDPSLLMLDEPTSGLDSSSAEMVVSLTKDMSREHNLCTLMTIHQPSAEMVAQFDRLILLAQGKLVYMGPTAQAVQYFELLGHPPTHPNPANFFIDLMTIDFSSADATQKSEKHIQTLVDAYVEFRQNGSSLPALASKEEPVAVDGMSPGRISTASSNNCSQVSSDITQEQASLVLSEPMPTNSWISELLVLLKREWQVTIRNHAFIYGVTAEDFCSMLFIGFVFFQLGNDQMAVQNRIGVLFLIVLLMTFSVSMGVLSIIMVNRSMLFRERMSAMYRMTTYFFAKILSLIPIFCCSSTIVYIGIYFIAHLQYDAAKFFIGWAHSMLLIYCCMGFGFMMSMVVKRVDVAFTATPVVLTWFVLFSGNLSNMDTITPVLRWIKYVSMMYYTYSGVAQNEFDGLEFTCKPNDIRCYKNGTEVVRAFALDAVPIWQAAVINIALGAGFYIIAYCLLRWLVKPRFVLI
ncbi:hypothetical protein H4R20_000109 [Coemansia guatemalensis]|uniref:ABC transporter domain-containing protein n=1 Tax=Coemansia guatemalensis TaxID=2761395 RepID=A0A9W8HZM9_9FUNG|nr:hypothetical protein H4R20_000109 [Coemansia guatemalensis]